MAWHGMVRIVLALKIHKNECGSSFLCRSWLCVVALCEPLKLDIRWWRAEMNAIAVSTTVLSYCVCLPFFNAPLQMHVNPIRNERIEQESVLTFIIIIMIVVIFVVIFGFSKHRCRIQSGSRKNNNNHFNREPSMQQQQHQNV